MNGQNPNQNAVNWTTVMNSVMNVFNRVVAWLGGYWWILLAVPVVVGFVFVVLLAYAFGVSIMTMIYVFALSMVIFFAALTCFVLAAVFNLKVLNTIGHVLMIFGSFVFLNWSSLRFLYWWSGAYELPSSIRALLIVLTVVIGWGALGLYSKALGFPAQKEAWLALIIISGLVTVWGFFDIMSYPSRYRDPWTGKYVVAICPNKLHEEIKGDAYPDSHPISIRRIGKNCRSHEWVWGDDIIRLNEKKHQKLVKRWADEGQVVGDYGQWGTGADWIADQAKKITSGSTTTGATGTTGSSTGGSGTTSGSSGTVGGGSGTGGSTPSGGTGTGTPSTDSGILSIVSQKWKQLESGWQFVVGGALVLMLATFIRWLFLMPSQKAALGLTKRLISSLVGGVIIGFLASLVVGYWLHNDSAHYWAAQVQLPQVVHTEAQRWVEVGRIDLTGLEYIRWCGEGAKEETIGWRYAYGRSKLTGALWWDQSGDVLKVGDMRELSPRGQHDANVLTIHNRGVKNQITGSGYFVIGRKGQLKCPDNTPGAKKGGQ